MADYRPIFTWTGKQTNYITGATDVVSETWHFDKSQLTYPQTAMACGYHYSSDPTFSDQYFFSFRTTFAKDQYFYRRERFVNGVSEQISYYGTSQVLPPTISGWTPLHSPVYAVSDNSVAVDFAIPNNIYDYTVSWYISEDFGTPIFTEDIDDNTYAQSTMYVALYGSDAQDDWKNQHILPYVNWTIYYDKGEGNYFGGYEYTTYITWQIEGIESYNLNYSDCQCNISLGRITLVGVEDVYFEKEIYNEDGSPNSFLIPYSVISSLDENLNNNFPAIRVNMTIPWTNGTYDTDTFEIEFPKSKIGLTAEGSITLHRRITTNDNSSLVIKEGTPQDDEDYIEIIDDIDDIDTPDDIEDTDIIYSTGTGCTTYGVTRNAFKQIIQWLWGDSSAFLDIKRVQTNPIENIITAKLFPFQIISNVTTQVVTIGNISSGIGGMPIDTYNPYIHVVSDYVVPSYYNSFLDYAPYTSAQIYLPYIGLKELDMSIIIGKTLNIYYAYDVVSGMCTATIYVNGAPIYMYEGNIAIDLPMVASNRAQLDASYIATTAGAVIGGGLAIAGTVASGGSGAAIGLAVAGAAGGLTKAGIENAQAQLHTQTTGTFSPNSWGTLSKQIVITYDRPTYQNIDTYNHTYGRVCGLSRYLSSLRGFTIVSDNVDLSNITCSTSERDKIQDLLTSGIIL